MRVYIETDELVLREFVDEDIAGIYELDSDHDVHQYLGANPIHSLDQAATIVKDIQQQNIKYGIARWAIIHKLTNEFVGWTGLKYETLVKKEMPYYDLGYRLKPKFWGKGIATETSIIALNYGFKILQLEEIFAGAHIDNIASNRVLQKVGLQLVEQFVYDSSLHNWYAINKINWQRGLLK